MHRSSFKIESKHVRNNQLISSTDREGIMQARAITNIELPSTVPVGPITFTSYLQLLGRTVDCLNCLDFFLIGSFLVNRVYAFSPQSPDRQTDVCRGP